MKKPVLHVFLGKPLSVSLRLPALPLTGESQALKYKLASPP